MTIPRQMPGINFSTKTEEWVNVGERGTVDEGPQKKTHPWKDSTGLIQSLEPL